MDALGKSYLELQSKLGQRADAMKAEVLADLRKEVPEAPDGYKVELPKSTLPEGFTPIQPPESDPMLKALREIAHEAGLKPAQFSKMTDAFYAWQASLMIDPAVEMGKVGENAVARADAVRAFLHRHLTPEEAQGVEAMTFTAQGVLGLEKLMQMAERGAAPGAGNAIGAAAGGAGVMSPTEAKSAIRDPEYNRNTDKGRELREKVAAFFRSGGQIPREVA